MKYSQSFKVADLVQGEGVPVLRLETDYTDRISAIGDTYFPLRNGRYSYDAAEGAHFLHGEMTRYEMVFRMKTISAEEAKRYDPRDVQTGRRFSFFSRKREEFLFVDGWVRLREPEVVHMVIHGPLIVITNDNIF